jgi:hypothetical protein
MEVWRVVAGRISLRKIYKAETSLTLKGTMHLNAYYIKISDAEDKNNDARGRPMNEAKGSR